MICKIYVYTHFFFPGEEGAIHFNNFLKEYVFLKILRAIGTRESRNKYKLLVEGSWKVESLNCNAGILKCWSDAMEECWWGRTLERQREEYWCGGMSPIMEWQGDRMWRAETLVC